MSDPVAEYEDRRHAAIEAELAARQQEDRIRAEFTNIRAYALQTIADLRAEKGRCQAVIDKTNAEITPGDTKAVARAGKRIADATIDLARLIVRLGADPTEPPA